MIAFEALVLVVALVTILIAGFFWGRHFLARRRESQMTRAKHEFHLRREWLEAHFLKIASRSGRPRGLAWVDCDFEDSVSFARERASGHLRALVGVTIRFEAVPGGGMEHVEAVRNERAATAVFRFDQGAWNTDGRAVFNLNPQQTIRHFHQELEAVAE